MPNVSAKWVSAFGVLFLLASTAIKDSLRVFDASSVMNSLSFMSPLEQAQTASDSTKHGRSPLFNGHGITTSTRGTQHDPQKRRTVFSFTTMPQEISKLAEIIRTIVSYKRYEGLFDAIHVNVPWICGRKREDLYPTTSKLEEIFLTLDDRVLLHRLMDYGPLTRYVGAVLYEEHPETQIITFDIDSIYIDYLMNETQLATEFYPNGFEIAQIPRLIHAAEQQDSDAVWCSYGEDFTMFDDKWAYAEHTFDDHLDEANGVSWNEVMMCRASQGISVRVKHFDGLGFNGTDYHSSCWFDDDRFLSFQWELLKIKKKQIHGLPYYERHQENLQKERDEKGMLWNKELRRRAQPEQPEKQQPHETHKENLSKEQVEKAMLEQLVGQQTIRRRRLGSLSKQVNIKANPRQHCTEAFLDHHPDLFPLSRDYSKFHVEPN